MKTEFEFLRRKPGVRLIIIILEDDLEVDRVVMIISSRPKVNPNPMIAL